MADDDNAPLTSHASINRAIWEEQSDDYERRHAAALSGENAMAWGLWRIPESELRVLGHVAGKDVLEYGCGAARWSIALAGAGARPVGLDLSPTQLGHARRLMAEVGVEFPLIEASAEAVPLADASFDIVFCDWGAMSFCDPHLTVPEVARLLRPGGLFAFSTSTPISDIAYDIAADTVTDHLCHDYFGLHHIEGPAGDGINFQLPYGEWLRLFRRHGLVVEDLIERPAPKDTTSSYRNGEELAWARRWPIENIWKLRKPPSFP